MDDPQIDNVSSQGDGAVGDIVADAAPLATGYADADAEAAFVAKFGMNAGAPEATPDAIDVPAAVGDGTPADAATPDVPVVPATPPPAEPQDDLRSQLAQLAATVNTMATALQAVIQPQQPVATPTTETPAPKPWETAAKEDYATIVTRQHLGADASPDLVEEYAQTYRALQQWSAHLEHPEHGARAKTQVANAQRTLSRIGREVERERELAQLRERVSRHEQKSVADIRAYLTTAVQPSQLRIAGYDVLADAAEAGWFDPNILLTDLHIDPANPRAMVDVLDQRAQVYIDAFTAAAAKPPTSTPAATPAPAAAKPVNPGRMRIPNEPAAAVKQPTYLSGEDADREFARFLQSRGHNVGAGAPGTR